jgi:hypothetical protein
LATRRDWPVSRFAIAHNRPNASRAAISLPTAFQNRRHCWLGGFSPFSTVYIEVLSQRVNGLPGSAPGPNPVVGQTPGLRGTPGPAVQAKD